MADDNGARRGPPPPPAGYKQAARPPPTPAARAKNNTPTPIPTTQASSGPKPAPDGVLVRVTGVSNALMLRICNALNAIAAADPLLQLQIVGDRILLARDGRVDVIAKISERGEVRIFLEDLGWYGEVPDTDAVKRGRPDATMMAASEEKIRALLGDYRVPNAVMGMLIHSKQAYISITSIGVFLAAASSRESGSPLVQVELLPVH